MKSLRVLFLTLCFSAVLCRGAAPQITVSSHSPRVGEVFSLDISSDEGRPEILSFPENSQLRFLPQLRRQSLQIINFKRSYTTSIAVQALKSGAVTLPQLQVKTGDNTYPTPPIPLQVRGRNTPDSRSDSGETTLFGELSTGGSTFYAGQEIPLTCTLRVPDNVELRQLGYPEITMDKAAFGDYRKVNPENPRFLPPEQRGRTRMDGRIFRTVVFRTSARIFDPGVHTFSAFSPAAILEPLSEAEGDSFFSFGQFSGRRIRTVEVPYQAKPITVQPLPQAPADTFFTGLIGPYEIQFSLNSAHPAVGELLTLECRVQGDAPENLKAPELNLAGFRVYPAEIRQKKGKNTVIRYAIIPLQEGKTTLKLALTVFDAKQGKYRTFRFEKTLQVAPPPSGRKPVSPAPQAMQKTADSPAPGAPVWKLKALDGRRVKLPLWRNASGFVGFCLASGILLILFSLLVDFVRRRRDSDPEYTRKKAAARAKKRFLEKLRRAENAEVLIEVANQELCEYLSAKLELPAGASATEIASVLRDPDDAHLLSEAGESAFQPGSTRSLADWKDGFLRLLKHVGIALLLFGSLFAAADEGTAAFERGDNKAAIRYFAARAGDDAPEVAALYNLGCALAAEGNDPLSLLAFTRALRLDPRSGDTLLHLNEVRSRLLLPPERSTESPLELLRTARDQFRPDEYAAICAALFLLFSVLFCFRCKLSGTLFAGISLSIFALEILFLLALGLQLQGPYSPRSGFITAPKAEMRTLPAEKSGRVEATLRGGTPVQILDEREHYVLVSGAGLEGWVRRSDLRLTFFSGGKRK